MKTTIKRHLELRIKSQLKHIKKQIENGCASYGEIIFLQNNISHIDKNDVILLEWAGVEQND